MTEKKKMWTINKLWIGCFLLVAICFSCATTPVANKVNENAKGIEKYNMRAYEEALPYFSRTLEQDTANKEALYYQGLIFWHLNDLDKSINAFSKAILAHPGYGKAYSMRGAVYIIKGEYEKSEKDLNKAIMESPDFMYSYINRAVVYIMTGRFDKGVEECDLVLKKQPENSNMHQAKSIALYNEGQIIPAINSALKAAKISPNWANPYFVLGGYFHSIQKKEDAKKFFKNAYRLNKGILQDMANILDSPADDRVKQMHADFIKLANMYLKPGSENEEEINQLLKILKN